MRGLTRQILLLLPMTLVPMPSTLKKKSLEQWQEELHKAIIDLKQRINDKRAEITREQIAKV